MSATPARTFVALAALACTLAGCSGIRVRTESDPTADVAARETWAWTQDPRGSGEEGPAVDDEDVVQRVRRAVESGLAAKGMREVTEAEADVLLRLRVGVDVEEQLNDPYYAYYTHEKYEEGTLTLDALDPETAERIWRGSGRVRLRYTDKGTGLTRVYYVSTSEERRWRVEEVVGAVLEEYPRQP